MDAAPFVSSRPISGSENDLFSGVLTLRIGLHVERVVAVATRQLRCRSSC